MGDSKHHAIRKRSPEPPDSARYTHAETISKSDTAGGFVLEEDTDFDLEDFAFGEGSDLSGVSAVGRSKEFRRSLAFELFCQAEECPDKLVALTNIVRALRVDPACLDARTFLALFGSGPEDEIIEELRGIVALGERALGPRFFQDNREHIWAAIEGRPYMRARSLLAEQLYAAGRCAEAISEYEALLSLNPNDNQGLRYLLLGCYLEDEKLDGAQQLLQQYGPEDSAPFQWGRVLERYLAGDLAGATKALTDARQQNPHVEDFLTRKKPVPKSRPDFYQPHQVSEALMCFDAIGGAWERHKEAVGWLKKEHGTTQLFVEPIKGKARGRSRSPHSERGS